MAKNNLLKTKLEDIKRQIEKEDIDEALVLLDLLIIDLDDDMFDMFDADEDLDDYEY